MFGHEPRASNSCATSASRERDAKNIVKSSVISRHVSTSEPTPSEYDSLDSGNRSPISSVRRETDGHFRARFSRKKSEHRIEDHEHRGATSQHPRSPVRALNGQSFRLLAGENRMEI